MHTNDQPFKFKMIKRDGGVIEGGAESKELCIDHVRQCLSDPQMNISSAVYLGKNGKANPSVISL